MTEPTPTITACPACGSADLRPFHAQDSVPSHSCCCSTRRRRRSASPRVRCASRFCQACGFVTNTAFDVSLNAYSTRYEETQAFSPRFNVFAEELAQRWIDTYDLHGKNVLEIGCGKG